MNSERTSEPIAIIGMSCLFPRAQSLQEYWANIKGRVDAITEIPPTHWRPEDYYDADPKTPDHTYAKRGGFIPVTEFDPAEYGITPQALEAIDTSQLLGLVVATGALQDAGYGPNRTFDRSRVGVILGLTGTLELVIPLGARLGHPIWRRALQRAGVPDEIAREVMEYIAEGYVAWQENSFPGLLGNVAAGRITNRLNLGGTNCVVDAACGSSLAAIHMALLELETGRADMVITGGIDTFNDIFMYMCFSKTPALSPTGDARPFSIDSDGTILGEGLGMLVLKRLSDARAAGDRIYAVIRGMGTSSDGKGKAIYAPSAAGQVLAIRRAYEAAGVTPSSIGLIEAHGTGTKVGDEIELTGLKEVFANPDHREPWVGLGSVKSQIGHTKAAAGAAGLIKVALALHHKVLPPTIKIKEPNPLLQTRDCPFYLLTEPRPWFAPDGAPRRAGVSSFGFGGSNFHTLVEEAEPAKTATDWDGRVEIYAFAAPSRQELLERLTTFEKAAAAEPEGIAAARSRQQFRADLPCRLTMVVEAERTPRATLFAAARARLADPATPPAFHLPEGVWYEEGPQAEPTAIIFPGQGSQYVNMGRDLVCTFPEAFDTVQAADRVVEGLAATIFPRPTLDRVKREQYEQALRATQMAQPALGAIGYGTFRVLQRFGFAPAAAAGHSYGELAALCAAGALEPTALWHLSRRRGELMAQGEGDRGGMIAVAASRASIEAVLAEEKLELTIANENAPEQTVLSGPTAAVQQAKEVFARRRLRATVLPVAGAFHSSLVAEAAEPFRAEVQRSGLRAPAIPVYANTTGRPYPSDPAAMVDLLGRQLANPVRFVTLIEAMYADGIRTFVETGPGGKIGSLIRAILGQRPHRVIAVDAGAGQRSGVGDLARALAALAAAGHAVRLQEWEDGERRLAVWQPRQRRLTFPICGANFRAPVPPRENRPARTRPDGVAPAAPRTADAWSQAAGTQSERPRATAMPMRAGPTDAPSATAAGHCPAAPTSSGGNAATQAHGQASGLAMAAGATGPQTSRTMTAPTAKAAAAVTAAAGHAPASGAPSTSALAARASAPTAGPSFSGATNAAATARPAIHSAPPSGPIDGQPSPTTISTKSVQTMQLGHSPAWPSPSSPPSATDAKPASATAAPASTGRGLGANAGASLEALRLTRETLAALQQMQAQTADLHRRFLEGQERAQMAIQAIIERSLGAAAALTGSGQSSRPAIDAPVDSPDVGIPEHRPAGLAVSQPVRPPSEPFVASRPLPAATGAVFEGIVAPSSAEAAPLGSPAMASRPAARPAAPASGSQPSGATAGPALPPDFQTGLLAIVGEKTGYPPEMLNLDMDMESDLGIDSIKRVEIMSAVQEKFPQAPVVQPDQLGKLRTLRQIIEFLAAGTGPERQPASTASSPAGQPASSRQAAAAPAGVGTAGTGSAIPDLQPALLAIVGEKTGYPPEMLNLDMDMESDLGIDSIKRVEIMSAVQEKFPQAPVVQPDQLGKLRTLRQIIEFLAAGTGPERQPASAASSSAGQAVSSSQAAGAPAGVGTARTGSAIPDLQPALLAIVGEKTGYPPDMLNLDMDMESDLGIDSIKRVEIMSAVQEKFPQAPVVQPDQLGKLRTLRQIIEFLAAGPGDDRLSASTAGSPTGSSPASAHTQTVSIQTADVGTSDAAATTTATPTSPAASAIQTATRIAGASQPAGMPIATVPLRRTVLTAVPYAEPAHPAPLVLPAGCTILVTDEGTAFTRELSKSLSQKGYKVVKLDLQAPESWVFPADTHALLVLGAPPKRQRKASLWGAEHEEALINAFFAVQKAGSILRNNVTRGPVLLATVSRLDGGFGLLDLAVQADPCQGGLAGLAKTAAREWTELTVRAFDLAPALEATDAVRALLPQLFRAGPIELGITAEGLYHLQEALDRPPAPPDPNPLFQPGEVVLVTGGARGVTAEISVALARTWRPTILLLGRTPAPHPEPAWLAGVEGEAAIKQAILRHAGSAAMKPRELEAEYRARLANREILATLQRIEAAGGRPLYRSVDVRDEKAVHTVVASIEAEVGPIVGLVHGAGVLRDRRIEDKTRDQLEDVLRTKITSLRHLLAALDPARLRLLGLFSSTTARLGRIGQVDYAMANEALNKIAQKWSRLYPACRTVSFNWGPWEGGMVTDSLKKLFRAEGVGLIPLTAGAELFIREIAATGQPPVEVGVVALEGATTTGPGPDRSAPTSQASLSTESRPEPTTPVTPAPQIAKIATTVAPASTTTTTTSAPGGPARRFRLAFERDLDLDRERYLAHHILNGEPVFPVAMMVEWMAHAAIHENPGLQFHGFDDLRVLKGIVLAGGRPMPIRVYATKIRPAPHGLSCHVEIRGTPGGRDVVHASAEVVLADRLPAPPESRVRPDISRPYPLPVAEIYRQHLFHGTMMQGIHRVQGWSPEGIVAESGTTPPPAAWVRDPLRPAWLSDPLALDVAFQLMILWTTQVGGAPSLPTAAARYRQYQASFPSDRVSVRISARQAGSYKAQAEIEFVDAQGGLVAVLEGYECMMNPSLREAFGNRTLERHASA